MMTENNQQWFENNREVLINWQSNQTKNHGLLNQIYLGSPVEGKIAVMQKLGDIMEASLIFRLGTSLIVSKRLWELMQSLNLPKFQSWEIKTKHRNIVYNDYYLIFFYYDYFHEVNFEESSFEILINKYSKLVNDNSQIHEEKLINHEITFASLEEYQDWIKINIYGSNDNIFRSARLKPTKIKFKSEVYKLDIIPSIYLDYRLIISERFKKSLIDSKIKHVEIFDCLVPVLF